MLRSHFMRTFRLVFGMATMAAVISSSLLAQSKSAPKAEAPSASSGSDDPIRLDVTRVNLLFTV